jgi:hypothetical protein
MRGRTTSMRLRLAIGFGVALVAALLLVPAAAAAPKVATTTDKAQVVTVIRSLEPNGCSYTGIIRWQAVKGVSSYTVLFNDSAFTPPEQSAVISEPFAQDQYDPTYPALNAPAGTHQGVWTGSTSSGPCESYDYSERLTDARVKYKAPKCNINDKAASRAQKKKCKVTLSGSVFARECVGEDAGEPGGECEAQFLPAEGRAVVADGPKGNAEGETNAKGYYELEVPKGSYTVRVAGVGKKVDPTTREVNANGNVSNLDFHLCKTPPGYEGKSLGCDLVEIRGTVVAFDGSPYSPGVVVAAPGDLVRTDAQSHFDGLLVPRGKVTVTAASPENSTRESQTVNATREVNTLKVKLPFTLHVSQATGSGVFIQLTGLPRAPVTVRISTVPHPNASCSSDQSQEVPTTTTRHANLVFEPTIGGFMESPRFCADQYIASVYQGSKTLGDTSFAIP